MFEAGSRELALDRSQLSLALAGTESRSSSTRWQRSLSRPSDVARSDDTDRALIRLRVGDAADWPACRGRPSRRESGTLDALAGVAAIAIERVQFLDERKAAELARQSEELKSALLASLGHDLRTPLTAIRVAAGNLRSSWPSDDDRQVQSELILTEVERLDATVSEHPRHGEARRRRGSRRSGGGCDPVRNRSTPRGAQVEQTLHGRRVNVLGRRANGSSASIRV